MYLGFQVSAHLTNDTVAAYGKLVDKMASVNTRGKSVDQSLASNIINIVEASSCALRLVPPFQLKLPFGLLY
jgi:hypothetical protein